MRGAPRLKPNPVERNKIMGQKEPQQRPTHITPDQNLRKMMKDSTVSFTRESILKYVDKCIVHWREERDNSGGDHRQMAIYYVDAYQSVRISLFGTTLNVRS